MISLEFYMMTSGGWTQVNSPMEAQGIEVELNFEDLTEVQTSVTVDRLTWVKYDGPENWSSAADLINNYVTNGTLGFPGVFWSLPFQIRIAGTSDTIFNGYVDLVNDAEFSCDKVVTRIREKGVDWMDEIGDGFTFDLLYQKGFITQGDYVRVPYVLSEIPDYQLAALYLIGSIINTKQVIDQVQQLDEILAEIAYVPTLPLGIAHLIVWVAYTAVLLATLVKFTMELIEAMIQPLKYYSGMTFLKHFQAACQHLGLGFSSSFFQNNGITYKNILGATVPAGLYERLVLMPEKTLPGPIKAKVTTGITSQRGHYNGSFKQFALACQEMFNGKFFLAGNILHFERADYENATQVYQIPPVRQEFHGINAGDIVSNYLVQLQIDPVDLNTINRYQGTNAKAELSHNTTGWFGSVTLLKGLRQPAIPFARAIRKTALTFVEQSIKSLFNTIPHLLPFSGLINTMMSGRLDTLLLSQEMISVPKIFIYSGQKTDARISPINDLLVSARFLYDNYHYIESFVPSAGKPAGNQKFIWNIPKIPFCYDDYLKIRGTGNVLPARIKSPDGINSKLLSLKWNPWNNTASIKYAEEKVFTTNLSETIHVNQGQ